MDELLKMSTVELAGKIKNGELSPTKLLETHIERINEVNPKINAVVQTRFDQAREEAEECEKKLEAGETDLPPLFGVPCTVKDCYALKGLPFAGGVWTRRNYVPDFDATVVERVKKAGAIIMGKTNVPEASMFAETYNHVYGRTNNPYDLSRGAGGSSGGEGSIVAASGSPFGIGADIGGSIRYPSAFNGVPGHKHTATMLPGTGHWPPAQGELANYNTYGPIARKVDDLAYILPILAGPDGRDPVVQEAEIKPHTDVDIGKLRVFYFDHNGQVNPSMEVKRAVSMAAGALASRGAEVGYWRPEGLEYSLDIWAAGMAQNPSPFIDFLGTEEEPVSLFSETIKFITRKSKVTFPALGTALIEGPGHLLDFRNKKMLALAQQIKKDIEEKLGDDGVIISPVFPKASPKHTWIWLSLMGVGYSGVINVLQLPATVIPIYHRQDNVPVSVQVIGKRWNDHLTLAAGKALEDAFGGWKPIEKVG